MPDKTSWNQKNADGSDSSDTSQPQVQQVQDVSLQDQRFVPMPAGGLDTLARQLFPQDREDEEKHRQHKEELFLLNSDRLRDDTNYRVGELVRIL